MQQSLVAPAGRTRTHTISRARTTRRDADWRFGPIVYQVLVDRFAPSANLAPAPPVRLPRRLREWDERPTRGVPRRAAGLVSRG